jgi:uncharacterized protein YndB with AHSA1/START domain
VTRIHVSTTIAAAPDDVWATIEPIERHVEWMADAAAIRFEGDQHRGTGTRFVCETRVGPLSLTDRMVVTEWEPGRAMGVRHDGLVAGTGRFTLTPVEGGTTFAWDEVLRFPWFLGGPVGAAIGGRLVLRRVWQHNLDRLRDLVESGLSPRS